MDSECQPQHLTNQSAVGDRADGNNVAPGYLGKVVAFEDGSWWRMTKALSHTKYQQSEPPFEARQVFECVCIKDPKNAHVDANEAVAKVKYQ